MTARETPVVAEAEARQPATPPAEPHAPGPEAPEAAPARVTTAPTARHRLLLTAAEQATPGRLLERVDHVSAHLALVVIPAAIAAGGFALVSATELEDVAPGWAIPAVAAAALSILLAVRAVVPARETLRPGDLDATEWWYERQIRRRADAIRGAAVLLAVAVLAAALPAVAASLEDADPQLDISLLAAGDRDIQLTVQASELPQAARLRVIVVGPGRAREAAAVSDAGDDGRASASLRLPPVIGQQITAQVSSGDGEVLLERSERIPIR